MSCILLTGGFGYIGSHTATVLANSNQKFIIVDNFSNCKKEIISKLEKAINKKVKFYNLDIRDDKKLARIINENKVNAVMHFAALKSASDSIINPLKYYEVNVNGTISVLKSMQLTGVKKFIFSSSATIYGEPHYCPIDENHNLKALNPYGRTKIVIENILKDITKIEKDWSVASLRYFNPIGAHYSGLIGDDPISDKTNNLMPAIINVVNGQKEFLEIYGDDYETADGTGIRDYIHIMDLSEAHFSALKYINKRNGIHFFNIGTGKGVSVLELIKTFEKVCGLNISYKIVNRREGDCSVCFANPKKANDMLNWNAKYDLTQMCQSAWEFAKSYSK
tara:strand:- start:2150 stop:3157 length:1008 start_codon:yes stop_codon:yes gene_type:complete